MDDEFPFNFLLPGLKWTITGKDLGTTTAESGNIAVKVTIFDAVCPICGRPARYLGDVVVCEFCEDIKGVEG